MKNHCDFQIYFLIFICINCYRVCSQAVCRTADAILLARCRVRLAIGRTRAAREAARGSARAAAQRRPAGRASLPFIIVIGEQARPATASIVIRIR